MPPRKAAVKAKVEQAPEPLSDSNSEELFPSTSFVETPSQAVTVVKYNANDSDRVQLAQAINNLTVKGEQFVQALNSFSTFRETVAQLDIQIETKKKQYTELLSKLEREYRDKTQQLQKEYSDLSKQLSTSHTETIRTNQIDLKNNQIEVTQKLREHKLKSCEELVKEFNMMLLKTEDYRNLNDTITRVNRELDDLKKKFESSCNSLRQEEKAKYDLELKRQQQQQELTYKTNSAEMKAQLDQQKREIEVLNRTIETLKLEIAEQRNLTKEIANASSKAQINQRFGKE